MQENKIKFWGELDQAARMLESVAAEYQRLWDGEEYRMRPGDFNRLASYLSKISISHSKMRDTLKLFEALLTRLPNEKDLQNITAIMEREAVTE